MPLSEYLFLSVTSAYFKIADTSRRPLQYVIVPAQAHGHRHGHRHTTHKIEEQPLRSPPENHAQLPLPVALMSSMAPIVLVVPLDPCFLAFEAYRGFDVISRKFLTEEFAV